jgi:hypothetical protein
MTWAQRLKRVFNIDIEVCSLCGGSVRVIVEASNRCIEDQDVIDRILTHLRQKEQETPARPLLLPRAWCHRPERHLERCHFSLGRIPDQQQPTSKEARDTAWHERLRALVQD